MEAPLVKMCGPAGGGWGKVKAVLPSYAPAAPGDGVLRYTLAIHKAFLSFSSDKAYSCCPQEKMSA